MRHFFMPLSSKEAVNDGKEKIGLDQDTDKIYREGFFSYADAEEAEKARKEQERIDALEKQMDYTKPEVVLALYRKILSGRVFHTMQGVLYLLHLQEYLLSQESLSETEIPAIPVSLLEQTKQPEAVKDTVEDYSMENQKVNKRLIRSKKKLEEQAGIYRIVILFLTVLVVLMLIIAGTGNSPTILNYKKQIQSEYAQWQEELSQKEKQLRDKERELEEKQSEENMEEP